VRSITASVAALRSSSPSCHPDSAGRCLPFADAELAVVAGSVAAPAKSSKRTTVVDGSWSREVFREMTSLDQVFTF
jgi:hypothetical protein